MVLQLLPANGGTAHCLDAVLVPRLVAVIGQGDRERVTLARDQGVGVDDRSIRLASGAGEEVVPIQEGLIEGLTVVAVLDIEINEVGLFALIEGEVVFADDADLRDGVALVDLHPVEAAVFIDRELAVLLPWRRPVVLGP